MMATTTRSTACIYLPRLLNSSFSKKAETTLYCSRAGKPEATSADNLKAADDTRSRSVNDEDGSKHAIACADISKSCVRLSLYQKRQALGLLTQRVSHVEIARRIKIPGRDVRKGFKDAEVDGLAQALTALSVGVRNAGNGSDVQEKELVEVLSDLQVFPGQPPHQGGRHRRGSDVGRIVGGPRYHTETLKLDAVDELMEVVERIFVAEANLSDDEGEESRGRQRKVKEDSTAAEGGARGSIPHPSYAELSSHSGALENHAESCGNVEAGHYLRRANMSFTAMLASVSLHAADIC